MGPKATKDRTAFARGRAAASNCNKRPAGGHRRLHVTPFTEGAIVSGLLLGALLGAALAGPLSDRLGRNRLVITAGVVFTIGAHRGPRRRQLAEPADGGGGDSRRLDRQRRASWFIPGRRPCFSSSSASTRSSVCLAAYIVAFAVSWGPVMWVMLPEVLPLSVRGGYAVICHIAFAFVAKFVTETKGRSLEEIESDPQETSRLVEARPA